MATHLVEINLISAQGLKPPSPTRRIQAYATAWIDPAAKLHTSIDRAGGDHPTWNEKLIFRVPASLLSPDSPYALSVEIYASGGFFLLDSLVGSVRLLLSTLRLLDLPVDTPSFAAVGVRRPSGRFHGVLNVGAVVLSRVPDILADALADSPAVAYRDFIAKRAPQPRVSPPTFTAAKDPALRECNRKVKGVEDDDDAENGGGSAALCGLGFPRKIHASPSDQNLAI